MQDMDGHSDSRKSLDVCKRADQLRKSTDLLARQVIANTFKSTIIDCTVCNHTCLRPLLQIHVFAFDRDFFLKNKNHTQETY